ncbi:hypothetical protein [Kluyvera sp. Awk 3]|uniref:hypothetical protein n=1 Tax=Kluyvera sp. Awk 3 TaxID=2963956 RepID=UPI002303F9BA|nr:hypothetical protein [Kluyvera sp. Awk 3]MDA8487460.1 hypothetical protein [Kluyvera sp. Awk 3]
MKKSWFLQDNLTTEEADELVARYRENNVRTKKSLDNDLIHWTVSAFLPESGKTPRQSKRWQHRCWGDV